MKKLMKRIGAVLMAVAMMAALGVTGAFAADGDVTITVNRDSTYGGTATEAGREYTWYRIFSANYEESISTNASGHQNGTANFNAGGQSGIAYTATAAVAAKLGTVNNDGTWTTNAGNKWFDLTKIAGSTNFSVALRDGAIDDVEDMQAAAAWLIENQAYEATGSMDFNGTSAWTADVAKGYYVIEGDVGDNLIAATTDITIDEKNVYPPVDKTQADEDNTTQNNETRDVAIGDVLTYNVKVTIPVTAAVGDKILVYDNNSVGLTYNNDVTVSSNEGNATVGTSDYTGTGVVAGAAWQRLITVTDGSQGKDVIFTFTMTVNDSALVDTDKKNESALKYGTGTGEKPWPYESTPDVVEYKTYYAGIEKVDGSNKSKKLEGVKFTLTENGTNFNVTKVTGKDYYIPGGTSNEVVTDSNGNIKIRGLDEDKTYVLTETENPNAGYNMLADPVTLTLHNDTASKTTYTVATEFDSSETYYVKSGTTYTAATGVTTENFGEGTYYTATTTGSDSYDGATTDKWTEVVNNKGTTLPSTGGIGTYVFTVAGVAIMAIAAGLLIVRHKKKAE
jgi:fimbrial isopeptide formation D2 family protein/LPXTG-motif cell wall-anchored protein